MDSRQHNEKGTPSKGIQSLIKETVQAKLVQNAYNCDSPLKWLPNVSTPPSRFLKIKNPFESHLHERLHTTVFSPSVFKQETCSDIEDKFKWTIEDISSLKPADIDETAIEQYSAEVDPVMEQTAQSKIERFFSKKEIVPSPMENTVKNKPLISDNASPKTSEKHYSSSTAQTILTLPPKLPAELETALKPYFSYTVDQQTKSDDVDSMLYKHLFGFDDQAHCQSPSQSVQSSPAPSCAMSPIQFSPYDENPASEAVTRRCESLEQIQQLRECDLFPITSSPRNAEIMRNQTLDAKLNFSSHMSIDMSVNVVPDGLDSLPPNLSLTFESTHSLLPEVLSDSTVNWDMEYKHISLESPKSDSSDCDKMDVSNSNTPKSKIFTSQRKKLSDSFLKTEELHDEENKENIFEVPTLFGRDSTTVKSLLFNRDNTDAGYCTGGTTSEEGSWSSSTLFASTPTKKKN